MCVLLFDYVAAIQKIHSVHGSNTEAIARAGKDWLEAVHGLLGFFDVRADLISENTGFFHLHVLLLG
jgi:hypothetical protein